MEYHEEGLANQFPPALQNETFSDIGGLYDGTIPASFLQKESPHLSHMGQQCALLEVFGKDIRLSRRQSQQL